MQGDKVHREGLAEDVINVPISTNYDELDKQEQGITRVDQVDKSFLASKEVQTDQTLKHTGYAGHTDQSPIKLDKMQNVTDIPGMFSQPRSSQPTQIICETNNKCVDVECSEILEIQEHVETILQEIHRTWLVDVVQEGECSSSTPLQQHVDDKSQIQKHSTTDHNKSQQHDKESQQDEDSPQSGNDKSKNRLSKKEEMP